MTAPWNVGWLNSNAQRAYPLSEEADGRDTSGSVQLPTDFLVDLVLTVPSGALEDFSSPVGFHLSSVAIFSTGVVLAFGYRPSDSDPVQQIGSVSVPASHQPNSSYAVIGQGRFADLRGVLTVGEVGSVLSLPGGVYTFDLSGGRLEPTTVRPSLRGVSSISLDAEGVGTDPLSGDLVLEAGSNVRFVTYVADGLRVIRVDAINAGTDLEEQCECEDPVRLLQPITSLSGVTPVEGNIQLVGDNCLQFESGGPGQLYVRDVCSEPCCGCEELGTIRSDLSLLHAQASDMRAQIQRLEGAVGQAVNSLLASKLSVGQGD